MPEDNSGLPEIQYRRLFPWTELFRAFRIALDLRKLAFAGAGVLVMLLAWRVVALPFPDGDQAQATGNGFASDVKSQWPWEQRTQGGLAARLDSLAGATGSGLDPSRGLGRVSQLVLQPFLRLMRPFVQLFLSGTEWTWSNFVYWLICGILTVLIWAFFGGVITRLAAVQVARDEKIGLREAIRFTCSKYFSFVGGPLFPFAGVLVFLALCLAGGLIARIPWIGDLFAGILWVLPLLAGFVMAIILVGVAVGWPLMFATVSAEGSDSFDALSRSYSYVYQRPWHYGFYWLVAIIYGTIVTMFVVQFATLLVYLSGWAVSWGAGRENVAALFAYAPNLANWHELFGPVSDELTPKLYRTFGARLVAVWLYLLYVLVIGFVYSYFWTASTIIYFLLRRSVDATDLDEVYLEEEEQEEFGMAPEMDQDPESPVIESPSRTDAATPTLSETSDTSRTNAEEEADQEKDQADSPENLSDNDNPETEKHSE